jgi:hypothetical protein
MSATKARLRLTLAGLFAIVTFAAVFFCGVRLLFVRVTANAVTPAEANREFGELACPLGVPEKATNVDIYARFQGGGASFDIEESGFLEWARDHDWPIIRVRPSEDPVWTTPDCLPKWPTDTKDAWYFSNSTHRGGWDVLFDRGRGRAYVYYSPR